VGGTIFTAAKQPVREQWQRDYATMSAAGAKRSLRGTKGMGGDPASQDKTAENRREAVCTRRGHHRMIYERRALAAPWLNIPRARCSLRPHRPWWATALPYRTIEVKAGNGVAGETMVPLKGFRAWCRPRAKEDKRIDRDGGSRFKGSKP